MTIDVPIILERGKRCRMYLYMCQEYKVKKDQGREGLTIQGIQRTDNQ